MKGPNPNPKTEDVRRQKWFFPRLYDASVCVFLLASGSARVAPIQLALGCSFTAAAVLVYRLSLEDYGLRLTQPRGLVSGKLAATSGRWQNGPVLLRETGTESKEKQLPSRSGESKTFPKLLETAVSH